MGVFALQRFVNMARLIREICQHEKPPPNEITEPPAFTVSKQERRGKAIVLVKFCARTRLGGSRQWEKQKPTKTKQSSRKKKEIEEQVPTHQVSLATVRKNFLLLIPKFATFLLLGSRFCFSFNPRTFLFPRTFHVHEMISLATRTKTLKCKTKNAN